jgi:hypothetical protein
LDAEGEHDDLPYVAELRFFFFHRIIFDLDMAQCWRRLTQLTDNGPWLSELLILLPNALASAFKTESKEFGWTPRQFASWKATVAKSARALAELIDETILDEPFGWNLTDDELAKLEEALAGPVGTRIRKRERAALPERYRYELDVQNLIPHHDLPKSAGQLRRLAEFAESVSNDNFGDRLPSKPHAPYVPQHNFVKAATWHLRRIFKRDERGVVAGITNALFDSRLDRKQIRAIAGSIADFPELF